MMHDTGEASSCKSRSGTRPIARSAKAVNKIADTLVWALFPVYFLSRDLSLVQIGWITGLYAIVWALAHDGASSLADGDACEILFV